MPTSTEPVQAHRHVGDVWTSTLTDYLQGKRDVLIAEVLTDGLHFNLTMVSDREAKRVGRILRLAGWERKTIRRNGKPMQGYKPVDDTEDP